MPTFDREIAKQAERLLIRDRAIDYKTSVFASEVTPGIPGVKPVTIKMIDAKTKEHVETLEVDACMVATGRVPNTAAMGLEETGVETQRGFVNVNSKMQVMTKFQDGQVVPNLYCIGDANGKMMLAHAASAQGISAIENIVGREHKVNHDAIPAVCIKQTVHCDCGCGYDCDIHTFLSGCLSHCCRIDTGFAHTHTHTISFSYLS